MTEEVTVALGDVFEIICQERIRLGTGYNVV
jgi:hypothetical protein